MHENKKDIIGKILLLISVILLGYLIINKLNLILFTIDEYFTYTLINSSVHDLITMTANDVHPPLYYLMLKLIFKILSTLNFNGNMIFVFKLVTILPYLIILLISGTKIRKEYGWLSAGVLSFTLISMSGFMYHYVVIRMYSWAILFSLLSFIYFKNLLDHIDLKYGSLFILFSVLGAYTHYFSAITSIILYLLLFVNLFINHKEKIGEIKKLIVLGISCIILYLPWLFILYNQLKVVHNDYWIPQITLEYFSECILYYAINPTPYILITVLSLFTLILLYILVFNNLRKNPDMENYYIFYGISLFILTLLLTTILSYVFKPILRYRYLLPSIAIFWFAISIYINKIDNKKVLSIVLLLILILGSFGIINNFNTFDIYYQEGMANENMFNDMNNDNTSVICISPYATVEFGTYLQSGHIFTVAKKINGVPLNHTKIKHIKLNEIDDYIAESNDTVYIIGGSNQNFNLTNHSMDLKHSIAELNFYQVR